MEDEGWPPIINDIFMSPDYQYLDARVERSILRDTPRIAEYVYMFKVHKASRFFLA